MKRLCESENCINADKNGYPEEETLTYRCITCDAPYCSSKCRKKDTKIHNRTCKKYSESDNMACLLNLHFHTEARLPTHDGTENGKAICFFAGPLDGKIPVNLRNLKTDEKAQQVFKKAMGYQQTDAMPQNENFKNLYYILYFDDIARIMAKMTQKQRQQHYDIISQQGLEKQKQLGNIMVQQLADIIVKKVKEEYYEPWHCAHLKKDSFVEEINDNDKMDEKNDEENNELVKHFKNMDVLQKTIDEKPEKPLKDFFNLNFVQWEDWHSMIVIDFFNKMGNRMTEHHKTELNSKLRQYDITFKTVTDHGIYPKAFNEYDKLAKTSGKKKEVLKILRYVDDKPAPKQIVDGYSIEDYFLIIPEAPYIQHIKQKEKH